MLSSQQIKRLLKTLFYGLEFILAIPISIPFVLIGWIGIVTDRFADASIAVSQIPFFLGEHIRYIYYKCTLKKVGQRVAFRFGSFCQQRDAMIGSRVIIGYYSALGSVHIGDDVLIGGFVNITSGRKQHRFDDSARRINQQEGEITTVRIGSDVWIGSNSIISADIGNRTVIGVGSIVIHPVEDHSIYAGNPAKLIKKIE
jgi:acetyltransferase-like isoleucine patch superfamily enzyme